MTSPPNIQFTTENEAMAIRLFNFWLDRGFLLDFAVMKRRFLFFGSKKFIVKMYAGKGGYEYMINEAIRLEKYEEAGRLTREMNELKKLGFSNI